MHYGTDIIMHTHTYIYVYKLSSKQSINPCAYHQTKIDQNSISAESSNDFKVLYYAGGPERTGNWMGHSMH